MELGGGGGRREKGRRGGGGGRGEVGRGEGRGGGVPAPGQINSSRFEMGAAGVLLFVVGWGKSWANLRSRRMEVLRGQVALSEIYSLGDGEGRREGKGDGGRGEGGEGGCVGRREEGGGGGG